MRIIKLKEVLNQEKNIIEIKDDKAYRQITVSNTGEIKLRTIKRGHEIGTKKQYIVRKGQFIYSRLGIHSGSFGLIPYDLDGAIVTGDMPVFCIDECKVIPEILIYLLEQRRVKKIFEDLTRGLAQSRIREKYFLEIEIPLPSIETQKKILEKINSVKNEIKQLEQNVSQDEFLLKKLRQAILSEAVSGKLVPQNPSDEPASELLKKINLEKNKLIKEGKLKKQKSLPEITDDEIPYDLPKGWVWTRLGEICEIINGRAYSKNELLSKGTPVLRVGNLFTSKKWYYSNLVLEPEKYCERGDLLYAWSASFGPYIWNGSKSIFHYHIWKLNLFEEKIKIFLYYLLLNETDKIKSSGHGIMMIHMTKENMEKRVIPLPPLAEQKKIVEKVDVLMKYCDELEEIIKKNKENSKRLLDVILEESFNSKH